MQSDIACKTVESIHVLVTRRVLTGQAEVVQELAALLPTFSDLLIGPPMAMAMGFPRDGKTDYDLAFPVSSGTEMEGFEAKELPSLPMFSVTHRGPLQDADEGENLADTWEGFVEFIRKTGVLLGDDPQRFIYHEGLDSVGSGQERFVLEVQYAYHLPMWLEAFEQGVRNSLSEDRAAHVLEGVEELAAAYDGSQAAEWVQAAVEKLDQEVPDERSRACILNGCAHHYIVQSAEILKQAWEASGHNLRKLVAKLTDESLLGGRYWLDESGSEPLLYIERRPARLDAYEQATDPREKRYQACFCPLVRDAIREGKHVSRTFCHCSGGWYVQEWEVVFGEKPRVDLVKTMLEGADACLFTVSIPPGFL